MMSERERKDRYRDVEGKIVEGVACWQGRQRVDWLQAQKINSLGSLSPAIPKSFWNFKPWSQGMPPHQEGGSETTRKDPGFHPTLNKSLPSLASVPSLVIQWTGLCVFHYLSAAISFYPCDNSWPRQEERSINKQVTLQQVTSRPGGNLYSIFWSLTKIHSCSCLWLANSDPISPSSYNCDFLTLVRVKHFEAFTQTLQRFWFHELKYKRHWSHDD